MRLQKLNTNRTLIFPKDFYTLLFPRIITIQNHYYMILCDHDMVTVELPFWIGLCVLLVPWPRSLVVNIAAGQLIGHAIRVDSTAI